MKKLVCVALTLLCSSRASAQEEEVLVPRNFDLSGIWVLPSEPITTIWSGGRCDILYYSQSNWTMLGKDYFELRLVGRAVKEREGGSEYLELSYAGTYHHHHGFASSQAVTVDGVPATEYDYDCAFEQIDYPIAGTMEIDLGFEGLGDFNLTLPGATSTPPMYRYATEMYVGGYHAPPLVPGGYPPASSFFLDFDGDRILVSVGFDTDTAMGSPDVPAGCNISLYPLPGDEFSLSQCLPRGTMQRAFVRADAPPNLDPVADVRGLLEEGNPDGTTTGRTITEAEVSLYLQDEWVRPKNAGETDEAYANYLAMRRRERIFVRAAEPDANGRFQLKDIPLFEKATESKSRRRALYTLVVRRAHKEMGQPPETLYFVTRTVHNVKASSDDTYVLIPFDGIGAKENLIASLSELSPTNYKPIEDDVQVILDELKDGLRPVTPEVQEGLRRAIWSERVAHLGITYADGMLEPMLKALASLISDILDVETDRRNFGDAKGKLDALRDRRDFRQQEASGFSAFSSFSNEAGVREIDERMRDIYRNTDGLGVAVLVDYVKKLLSTFLYGPLAATIDAVTGNVGYGDAIKDILEKGFCTLIDILVQGNYGSFVNIVIEEIVTGMKSSLLDDPLNLSPLSYAEETRQALSFSYQSFDTWNRDDRTLYVQDRDFVVAKMTEINSETSDVIIKVQYAEELAEAFSSAADIFELGGNFVPAFKTAEKLSNLAKHLSNGASFILPARHVFGELTDDVNAGMYRAWGVTAQNLDLVDPRAGQMVPINPRIWLTFVGDADALRIVFEELIAMLRRDELPQALVAATSDLEVAQAGFFRGASAFQLTTEGMRRTSDEWQRMRMDFEQDLLRVRVETAIARQLLMKLVLGVANGDYASPQDARYLRDRHQVIKSLVSAGYFTREYSRSFLRLNYVLQDPLERSLPGIMVTDLELASSLTGEATASASPETFTLRARIRNVSTSSIGSVGAALKIHAPDGSLLSIDPIMQSIGQLEGDDGVDGSGPDERDLTWQLDYSGDLMAGQSITVTVNLTENGAIPSSFLALPGTDVLLVDPSIRDADGDFLPDAWERSNGLDPALDDAEADLDADGLTNERELGLGTPAGDSDADDDGLSDGDEVNALNGFATSPLSADTDGDGAADGIDGDPLDGSSQAPPATLPEEPRVSIDKTEVILTATDPIATVRVTNAGTGTLAWTAAPDDDAVVSVNPQVPQVRLQGDELVVMGLGTLKLGLPNDLDGTGTTVRVIDAFGAVHDEALLTVWIGARGSTDGGVPGTDGSLPGLDGSLPGDDAGTIAGRDAGGEGNGEEEGGGCGCNAASRSNAGSTGHLLVLFALAGVLALRSARSIFAAPNR